jgi:hypothetical protein
MIDLHSEEGKKRINELVSLTVAQRIWFDKDFARSVAVNCGFGAHVILESDDRLRILIEEKVSEDANHDLTDFEVSEYCYYMFGALLLNKIPFEDLPITIMH